MTANGGRFRIQSLVLALSAMIGGEALSIEQPEYTVLYTDGDIEYRQYEPYLVSATVVHSAEGFEGAGNEGFRRLFSYISGANSGEEKIAMTAPVERIPGDSSTAVARRADEGALPDAWEVTFVLPAKYAFETAPVPADPRVQIRQVPGRLMAVLRYSGRWTEKNLLKNLETLRAAVDAESLTRIGEFQSAAYNSPFMPPFMRRNEVMVEVDRLPAKAGGESSADLTYAR